MVGRIPKIKPTLFYVNILHNCVFRTRMGPLLFLMITNTTSLTVDHCIQKQICDTNPFLFLPCSHGGGDIGFETHLQNTMEKVGYKVKWRPLFRINVVYCSITKLVSKYTWWIWWVSGRASESVTESYLRKST